MSTKRVRFSVLGKLISILFFLSLTVLAGLVCIKPVSSSTIKDTFIDTALSDKVTDVIYEVYPDVTSSQLETVEKFVDENPAVDKLVDKYLTAVAEGQENFQVKGTEQLFAGLNEELIDKAAGEFGITMTEEQKQQVTEVLKAQEEQIDSAVKYAVENLSSSSPKVRTALKLYDIATSTAVVGGCAALTVFLGLLLIIVRKDRVRFMNNLGISGILSGAVIGAGVPAGVWLFGDDITNRLLGRTADMDVKICMELGALLAVTGVVLIVLRAIACVIGRKSLSR